MMYERRCQHFHEPLPLTPRDLANAFLKVTIRHCTQVKELQIGMFVFTAHGIHSCFSTAKYRRIGRHFKLPALKRNFHRFVEQLWHLVLFGMEKLRDPVSRHSSKANRRLIFKYKPGVVPVIITK
jgi:hypothetical protein